MKYLSLLLLLAAGKHTDKKGYTVMFVRNGDTTYLMNQAPISYDHAMSDLKDWPGTGRPIEWDSIYRKSNDTVYMRGSDTRGR